jgi:hypothetical protein
MEDTKLVNISEKRGGGIYSSSSSSLALQPFKFGLASHHD